MERTSREAPLSIGRAIALTAAALVALALFAVALDAAFAALLRPHIGAPRGQDPRGLSLWIRLAPWGVGIVILGVAGWLRRPAAGLARLVTSRGSGGASLRRTVAAVVFVIPVTVSLLVLAADALGPGKLPAILAAGTVALVAVVIAFLAFAAIQLDRARRAECVSRQRAEDFLSYAPLGVLVADHPERFIEVNAEGARLLGYAPHEIVGRSITDLLPDEELARFEDARERLFAGEHITDRWTLMRKDGTSLHANVTATILPDGRWLGFVVDITRRTELERELQRSLADHEYLSRSGLSLSECLELDDVFEKIGTIVTERLADICTVDFVEGGALRRTVVSQGLSRNSAVRDVLGGHSPTMKDSHPIFRALRGTEPKIVPERGPALIARLARTPEHERALTELGLHALMLVPVRARGELIAMMSLGRCGPDQDYDEDDRTIGAELAVRVGLALDNVRLYHESKLQAAMITNLAEGVVVIRASDQRIVFTNPRADEILGYAPGELFGAPMASLGASTLRSIGERSAQMIEEIERAGIWRDEFLSVRKDGSTLWIAGSVSIYEHEEHGDVWIAALTDISRKRRLEDEAARALVEKEVLLKEVHHRVKNNLQVISSLFSLQRGRIASEEVRSLLDESRLRIQSIALVHEQLYRSTDLAAVDFEGYLRALVAAIRTSFGAEHVTIETHAPDVFLDIEEAVPCALILSELISNAMKHAFPGGRRGRVSVTARSEPDARRVIEIADDGVGIPEDFDWTASRSLGLRIVRDLTRQLRGEVTLDRSRGTRFTLRFRSKRAARALEDEERRIEA